MISDNLKIFGIFLLASAIFGAVLLNDRSQIQKLDHTLGEAQHQIELLQATHTAPSKKQNLKFAKPTHTHEQLFTLLAKINGVNNLKKIKYLPGELTIQDLSLVDDDQFVGLLDFLFDKNMLITIEVPPKKGIKEKLIATGVLTDYFSNSKDGMWRIKLRE